MKQTIKLVVITNGAKKFIHKIFASSTCSFKNYLHYWQYYFKVHAFSEIKNKPFAEVSHVLESVECMDNVDANWYPSTWPSSAKGWSWCTALMLMMWHKPEGKSQWLAAAMSSSNSSVAGPSSCSWNTWIANLQFLRLP